SRDLAQPACRAMLLLRALLLGDVAKLIFPTHRYEERQEDRRHDGDGKGIGYLLERSFGKVSEASSPRELPSISSSQQQKQQQQQEPAATIDSGLRCLQLSLEEAFYLAHVDESLALAVPKANLVVPTAPIALPPLPPPPPRERRGFEEPPGLLHDRHRRQQTTEEAEDAAGGSLSGEEAFGCGFGGGEEGSGRDGGGGGAPLLSAEEAWRYCCNRRPDFPAKFAVYRHFRIRSFTVDTGHKYGAHYVLYEGPPDECHSRYCVHVTGGGGGGDSWSHVKTMTRLMPDVAKSLLVCGVAYRPQGPIPETGLSPPIDTSSLAALAAAEVTALHFSRCRDSDGGGGGGGKRAARKESGTILKSRRPVIESTGSGGGNSAKKKKKGKKTE
ncbi:unnamed protein product, partial [Ectocarpus sp. 4 AP-2014]